LNTTSHIADLFKNKYSLLSFDVAQISISREKILRGLGMQLHDADEYLLDLIEQSVSVAKEMLDAKGGYIVTDEFSINIDSHTIEIQGMMFDTHKQVTLLLKKSECLIIFACTIGDEIEKESKRQMALGNALEGYIFDLIGSEFAECVAEQIHNEIETKVAKKDLKVSNRYSPGYCNWPVSDQHKLFSVLDTANCGIKLTHSSLMMPVKSVSGLLGIGKDLRRVKYKCDICTDKNCIMRKK
jgi:hypothetical protein